MPAPNNFIAGREYDLGNGTTAVWGGKKGWVTPEAYMAMKGQGQQDFDQQTRLVRRLDEADRAANIWDATGFMGGLESKFDLGGTAGFDLDQSLVPVRASAFIKNIQSMRENSPTGGAVGDVSNKEGEKLQGTDAILNVGQSRPQFQREVREMRGALTGRFPGLDASNPIDLSTVDSPAQIPQGAYFRAADGKVYQNRKGAGAPRDDPTRRRQLEMAQQYRGSRAVAGTAGNPYVPADEAAYNRLPAGAYYLHPDLGLQRKKGR